MLSVLSFFTREGYVHENYSIIFPSEGRMTGPAIGKGHGLLPEAQAACVR